MRKTKTSFEVNCEHRIAMKYDASLNSDRSVDARKAIALPSEKITQLKPSRSISSGQYTPSSSKVVESKLVTYKYLPNHIFRKFADNSEIPILERVNGEWFVCEGIIIKDKEFQALRAFRGAYGMDVDALMNRKRKKAVNSSSKTTNVDGRSHYRCDNPNYEQVEKNLLDSEIRRHNAKKQKNLLSSVQIVNVKRKK